MTSKILCFAGSIRTGSFSAQVAQAVAAEIADIGGIATVISLDDYDMPLFNEDLEQQKGLPEATMRLARMMAEHDGLVICTPEYNASIPPLLKNTLDWLSRVKTDGDKKLSPYGGKVAAICASSPGKLGGIRVLPHLREVLMNVGVQVITQQVAVSGAAQAFGDNGRLKDDMARKLMQAQAKELLFRTTDYSRRK